MKQSIILILFALGFLGKEQEAIGQTTSRKAGKSSSKSSKTVATSKTAKGTTSITPAIDSFKRSTRYTPGRPYEAANANSNATQSTTQAQPNTTVNANANTSISNPQVNTSVQTSVNVNSTGNMQRSVPESPSMERNRADVNQRQVNENSKNAISDMNSGQVNALNKNQMAPPPQNWGNNQPVDNKWGRNTVGESQWTPTATISSSFVRDFPNVSGATWIRDVRDTANYSARYRTGENWSTTTYTATGARIDTRTELPVSDLPRAVALYRSKQAGNNVQFDRVTRVERPSLAEVYEVRLTNGKVVLIDGQGVEVP